MIPRSEVAGFLLAGGQSSRMGSNKALLRFEGELLVERGLRILREVSAETAIAGGIPELAQYARLVPDYAVDPAPSVEAHRPAWPDYQGPLAGIVSALLQTTAEWNLLIAVDMPLLPSAALHSLLAAAGDPALVTLAQAAGQVQPLCGVYSRSALPVLRAELEKGNRRVRAAAEATGACSYWQASDPGWFANVNTPDELKDAEQLARAGRTR